jgi:uncharacterized membrane protein YcaP (DUF421 family)
LATLLEPCIEIYPRKKNSSQLSAFRVVLFLFPGSYLSTLHSSLSPTTTTTTRSVSHFSLAIYIIKYLKAKEEELWKLKYFTIAKIYLIFKKSFKKRNQDPSRY